ncbi:hypothetical protein AB0903_08170 [Streptomyces sp. NPDC048389]|uniref:hypothetical protein n=1 Tax=Streptomyces sp. NPDC048389 TaxID=3154622 RepID=UPI003452ACDC
MMTSLLERAPRAWNDDEDPNAPAIPRIPGPRKEPLPTKLPAKVPQQPGPQQSGTPSCCGRPMRRDGRQLVCGRCKSWTDTGVAHVVASPAATPACPSCKGKGGRSVDTSSGGVTRKTWKSCTDCRGRGTR